MRCGERLVHLRRAGSGPPVSLLHESPSSSAMMLPLIEALAIRRVAALGVHTGGSCLAELAARYPERLTVGVIGGLVAFPEAERDELLERYLVDFAPEPSAAHMLRVRHRMRSQFMHFPWYEGGPPADRPAFVRAHGETGWLESLRTAIS